MLVLEQHFVAGDLTQTFSREGFTWDVGLHYLGDMHEGGGARRVLDWLSDEAIHFSPVGVIYDSVHFPQGFEVPFPRTQAASGAPRSRAMVRVSSYRVSNYRSGSRVQPHGPAAHERAPEAGKS